MNLIVSTARHLAGKLSVHDKDAEKVFFIKTMKMMSGSLLIERGYVGHGAVFKNNFFTLYLDIQQTKYIPCLFYMC